MVFFSWNADSSLSTKMTFQVFSHSPFPSLLCFMLLFLVKVQLCLTNPDMYQYCSPHFTCGNIKGCYPFWGRDRPKPCGHPDMELICENNTTTTVINDMKYRVLNMSKKDAVLKIARQDYLEGICPPELLNTTIDSEIFEYTSEYEMLTLLYGVLAPENKSCSMQEIIYKDGFIQTEAIGRKFNVSVKIPVAKSLLPEAKRNLSVLVQAVNEGFDVKWKVNGMELCSKCFPSGGNCGYEIVSNQTICYCQNEPFNSTTSACSMNSHSPELSFNRRGNTAIGTVASAIGIIILLSILLQ